MLRYFHRRLAVVSFYLTLDVVTASLAYIISYGEPGLTPGQLMIRMLGAMLMANGLIGGPDSMMYWQESGRRIKAEDERDAAVKERDDAVKERDAVIKARDEAIAAAIREARAKEAQERAAFEQRLTEHGQEIQTLRAQVAELLEERSNRRRRRRRRRLRE